MSKPEESVSSPQRFDWFALMVACCRLSIHSKCLALSLAGLLITTAAWKLVGIAVLADADGEASARNFHAIASTWHGQIPPPIRVCPFLQPHFPSSAVGTLPIDPVWGVPFRLVEPFRRSFLIGQSWRALTYYLVGGFISLAVWAFVGGAVTRIAVIQLGLRRPLGLGPALRFTRGRWAAFFSGPALALVGIAMLAFPFIALGWLMRLDWGVLIAGILWIPVLLAALLMAILAFGLLVAWPLMWGAIGSEDGDAFDALSRAYAYALQRPLHYLLYAGTAACLGFAGWILVWCLAETVIDFGFWAVSLGMGTERLEALIQQVDVPRFAPNSVLDAGAVFIAGALALVRAVASSCSFSYFWCVVAAIYLLLRRDTDQTQLDDIPGDLDLPTEASELST